LVLKSADFQEKSKMFAQFLVEILTAQFVKRFEKPRFIFNSK